MWELGYSATIGQSEATCMWCGGVIKGLAVDVLSVQMHTHCEEAFRGEQDEATHARTAPEAGVNRPVAGVTEDLAGCPF